MPRTVLEIIDFSEKPVENMYSFETADGNRTSYVLTAQGFRNVKEWCAKRSITMPTLLNYIYENKGKSTFAKCIREVANAVSEAPDEIIL